MEKVETPAKKARDPFWDIMKGIGALCIVAGHAAWNLVGTYVYTFHLAIFFFIGGALFKPEHAKDPWKYLGSRFKNMYGKYVMYSFIYIFLHNTFIGWGLYSSGGQWGMQPYTINDLLTNLYNALLFGTNETLLEGSAVSEANENTVLGEITLLPGVRKLLLIEWFIDGERRTNHTLTGQPSYAKDDLIRWAKKIDEFCD